MADWHAGDVRFLTVAQFGECYRRYRLPDADAAMAGSFQRYGQLLSRWRAGASIRQIAHELGLARNTVRRVLAKIEARRVGSPDSSPTWWRPSRVDPSEPVIRELLGRYPDLTAVRLLEELRQRGFTGGYTVVRQRVVVTG